VPEAGPARGDPAVLLATGPDEVADRLQARRPQMRPVRVRPFDRIAHDHDQSGARNRLAYPAHRGAVVQVQRRRLAPQRPGRSRVEQGLVIRPAPYLLAVGQRVPRAAPGRRRSVGEEELRLLDRGQVKARVTGQRDMQRRGARLRGADHQEVGQGHRASRDSRRILHDRARPRAIQGDLESIISTSLIGYHSPASSYPRWTPTVPPVAGRGAGLGVTCGRPGADAGVPAAGRARTLALPAAGRGTSASPAAGWCGCLRCTRRAGERGADERGDACWKAGLEGGTMRMHAGYTSRRRSGA
jgi:hypothetical protein